MHPAWDAHQSGSPNPNPNLLTGQRDWKPAVFQSPELGEKTCGVQGCTCRCCVFPSRHNRHWSISWCKESQIFFSLPRNFLLGHHVLFSPPGHAHKGFRSLL